jgi:hypothetical protein
MEGERCKHIPSSAISVANSASTLAKWVVELFALVRKQNVSGLLPRKQARPGYFRLTAGWCRQSSSVLHGLPGHAAHSDLVSGGEVVDEGV